MSQKNNDFFGSEFSSFFDKNKSYSIKPLDSNFESIGEAFFSYMNSTGWAADNDRRINGLMVSGFLHSLGVPVASIDSDTVMASHQYFKNTDWLESWLNENQFFMAIANDSVYLKVDQGNRPIAILKISPNANKGHEVTLRGPVPLVKEFRARIIENIQNDEIEEARPIFHEVVIERRDHSLKLSSGTVENKRQSHPAFYPYLGEDPDAVIEEFLLSDCSVLILMGAPGTGKSSLVSSAIEKFNLLPIYAKQSDVIEHPEFVNFVFDVSDRYMGQISGTNAKRRKSLIEHTSLLDDSDYSQELVKMEGYVNRPLNGIGRMPRMPYARTDADDVPSSFEQPFINKEESRAPVVIVEDADGLIGPRTQGNKLMQNLLNATDGIGSSTERKIIFTTNLNSTNNIDEALLRDGRCFAVVNFQLLTPEEAIAARHAQELPVFEETPTKDMALATALKKPRSKFFKTGGRITVGFVGK